MKYTFASGLDRGGDEISGSVLQGGLWSRPTDHVFDETKIQGENMSDYFKLFIVTIIIILGLLAWMFLSVLFIFMTMGRFASLLRQFRV